MATKQQIKDQIFDIENRIKPLFPKWMLVIFVGTIGLLGAVGIIAILLEFNIRLIP